MMLRCIFDGYSVNFGHMAVDYYKKS